MKKYISVMLAVAILLSLCVIPAYADSHWAEEYAKSLIEKGIVSGYEDGSLKLDNTITRAEFVKILNKSRNLTSKETVNFPDVSQDKWYYEEMLIAKSNGYITGDENGNANPEQNITRAESSVILARILELDTTDLNSDLTDINEIPDWAKGSIVALVKKGIIKGYEDGSFKADNTLTRGEGFTLIYNISPKQPETPKEPEKENETSTQSGGSSVSVSTRPSGGGSSGGGGGGGSSGIIIPAVADVPKLKYNEDEGIYTLAWGKALGAKDYNIKISLAGEDDYIINNYKDTSIDLYSHFSMMAKNRTNAEEIFYVSVMANGLIGYKNSAYSNSIDMTANFESLDAPVISEKNGVAGGKHRVIVSWSDVSNNNGYNVEIVKSDNTKLTLDTDYTYDTLNNKVVIPDTSVCDVDTKIYVTAISSDKLLYKDSLPAEILVPTGSSGEQIQNGSEEYPWIITSGEQLAKIGDGVSGYDADDHYVITRNITVTKPIGSKVTYSSGHITDIPFSGTITGKLNGTDYKPTIILNIGNDTAPYESDSICVGFVNYLDTNGEIKNIKFEGAVNVTFKDGLSNLTDRSGVAAIAGYSQGKITDCTNNATVIGPYLTSGIASYVKSTTIAGCANLGNITGTTYVGGITSNGTCTITNSYNKGNITGTTYVGGICASTNNSTITSCANYGKITATSSNGAGLVAWSSGNYKLDISKCFNAGDIYVKKGAAAGLFSATLRTQSSTPQNFKFTFTDCYNTGKLYDLNEDEMADPAFTHTIGRSNYEVAYELVRVYSSEPLANFTKDASSKVYSKYEDVYYMGTWNGTDTLTLGTSVNELELNTLFENDTWATDESADYKYPQIIGNLHKKEEEVIPALKTFSASSVLNGANYDVIYEWSLPEGVKALSIKIVNNTDIEDVSGGYIVLDHEGANKTGYTISELKPNCYYEIFIKLEFLDENISDSSENYEYLIPII